MDNFFERDPKSTATSLIWGNRVGTAPVSSPGPQASTAMRAGPLPSCPCSEQPGLHKRGMKSERSSPKTKRMRQAAAARKGPIAGHYLHIFAWDVTKPGLRSYFSIARGRGQDLFHPSQSLIKNPRGRLPQLPSLLIPLAERPPASPHHTHFPEPVSQGWCFPCQGLPSPHAHLRLELHSRLSAPPLLLPALRGTTRAGLRGKPEPK